MPRRQFLRATSGSALTGALLFGGLAAPAAATPPRPQPAKAAWEEPRKLAVLEREIDTYRRVARGGGQLLLGTD
ncbi:hypothetical protein [Streptomyces luteolifulvus]|uniref:hypothetical protein n=1 Tax=Streptomyces luteolifulvus TaxID=2615112 RepID=UPI001CD9E29A|nr:hypothetical protein [Streptomyces luteolifulvus]